MQAKLQNAAEASDTHSQSPQSQKFPLPQPQQPSLPSCDKIGVLESAPKMVVGNLCPSEQPGKTPNLLGDGYAAVRKLLGVSTCESADALDPQALDQQHCKFISQATEIDVNKAAPELAKEIQRMVQSNSDMVAIVREGWPGATGVKVGVVKLLINEVGAHPQIPHADDFCNHSLFVVAMVLPDQRPTECIRYEPAGYAKTRWKKWPAVAAAESAKPRAKPKRVRYPDAIVDGYATNRWVKCQKCGELNASCTHKARAGDEMR
jgi:hypothetical protein